ncbi:YihY/virulence factor BrkB family protein [Nocardioides anomalus]|uniref:YihY/virulence factor BrkB family protein n=1 Tax=Nocardioides anomalus TaxID=2712223 RepID=A0A6G6WIY5_9ACTN|nr:YihY/virulence factor BrkB family protein [Nocardioides anomalus]QIG45055.1 YihY/virulence factor BrkB family protein [Nocardioides anomalus]
MGFVGALDRAQRKRSVLGFPVATFYKFFDDQGPYLAAIISFYALLAIFPLLLLAVTIFGFFLQGDAELQKRVIDSALGTFPIIGDELGRPERLQGSTTSTVVGILAATYGSLGLGQALQNALNTTWSVPRNRRPNLVRLRLKSLGLLVIAGASVLAITTVSTIGSETEVFGPRLDTTLRWAVRLLTVLLIGLVLTAVFRLAAARRHHLGRAAPGAFTVAVLWQGLQYVGTVYTTRVLRETAGMSGVFGLVLGLIGVIYVAAFVGVLGMEVNTVLARRLWPRSLASLFVDRSDLTEADRRAYASYVRAQMHKSAEIVEVSFEDPQTGELLVVDDPGPRGKKGP